MLLLISYVKEAEEEEDPSNLQLAWEMLELAKVAYTHKIEALTKEEEKRPIQMKVCETLLTLGEVSLENETYEQAVVDITECLTKRKVQNNFDFIICILYWFCLIFS